MTRQSTDRTYAVLIERGNHHVVQIIERIDRILSAFTAEQPEMTLAECVAATSLNKSSVYRLLHGLAEVGLVEKLGSRWRLGPRVVAFAAVRLGTFDLQKEAMAALRELRQEWRVSVAVSAPNGSDVIYLERLDSPDPFGISTRLGARAPLWAGSAGRAILAKLSEAELARRLDVEEWQRLPEALKERVRKEIKLAQEKGYSVDDGIFFVGVAGISASVDDSHGEPVGAISVIFPADRLRPELAHKMGTRLTEVARQIQVNGAFLS